MKSVRVLGLGLMGTNLGLKLLSEGITVYGEDVDAESLNRASSLGIDISNSSAIVDLTILAMPINSIVSILGSGKLISNTKAILDIGGTKEKICNLMDSYSIPSIGGHPMCGVSDNYSWKPDLKIYQGATFLLCETKSMDSNSKKIVLELVKLLNSKEIWIDRIHHDEIISITSHLPHLISTALVGTAKDNYEINEIMGMAAGGFDGATRLTRTNPEMIKDMYDTNSENINKYLKYFLNELMELMSLQERDELIDYLHNSVHWRRALSEKFGERPLS
jgi:prephenate dehydrogenase|tara:strand:- start:4096 stop:4926 length:831 start_codon:yes stop_codon:yes gene_type:complete